VLGRYDIIASIGSGAFAEVFLARDRESGVPHALKVLRDPLDPAIAGQIEMRFLAEQRIASAIGHPAVVSIRESSGPGERPYFLAMEYVEGRPFFDHLRRFANGELGAGGPPSTETVLAETARLAQQVAEAMALAHDKGIVHRDLKPDNVLVTRESGSPLFRVKVVDFGIAKAPLELFSVHARSVTRYWTQLGTIMGSPPYMAPEQNGAAHTVTGKADVFALGVMLFLTVLGLEPEPFERGEKLLHLPNDFDRLVEAQPPLPPSWGALLRRMVALEPDARPDMREVSIALSRLARSESPFALAVEAWLTRGRLPSARKLQEFARAAEDEPYLTADEACFLRRAPLEKLARTRMTAALGLGVSTAALVFAASSFAAGARARETEPPEPRSLATTIAPLTASSAACAEPVREEAAEQAPAASAAPAASHVAATALRGLERRLAACRDSTRTVEARRDELSARLDTVEGELDSCRTTAERTDAALTACQRELEAKSGQLDESFERLRLCNKSLRQPEGTEEPAP